MFAAGVAVGHAGNEVSYHARLGGVAGGSLGAGGELAPVEAPAAPAEAPAAEPAAEGEPAPQD